MSEGRIHMPLIGMLCPDCGAGYRIKRWGVLNFVDNACRSNYIPGKTVLCTACSHEYTVPDYTKFLDKNKEAVR